MCDALETCSAGLVGEFRAKDVRALMRMLIYISEVAASLNAPITSELVRNSIETLRIELGLRTSAAAYPPERL
jgi:hypothetical protein